jgi:hypothetical protein
MVEDDPGAVWALLRHIYGHRAELPSEHPWQYWLELAKVADKHLAPSLVMEAADAMMMHGFHLTVRVDLRGKAGGPSCDVDGICDILDALQEIDSNPKVFDRAERLAKRIQEHIHDSDRFRAHLLGNPKLMLRIIENETRQPDAHITGIDACEYHMQTYLARTDPFENGPCQWCENEEIEDDERPVERYNMWYVKCGS